ncbi:Calmodulin-interacting protein 111 [Dichanthelium oligosanthes]|uniref:Calmodulin-interacting protein 111 n=1 Tax=Dichanthelium oligosanthes TaxID=888268 RepID=A0A1E5VNU4_9POAL|nr:Calmodulin-interacting protein 111 [Dichanthelium oligosanthes]
MPPSKGKKKPQQQPAASPRTPSSRSSRDPGGRGGNGGGDGGDGERSVDLPSIAAAAAARFPALVPRGGDGCFAGTVAEVAPRGGSGGGGGASLGRLWLSEAAMVGAGMRPGCLVSVSLVSWSSDQSDGFPLDNLFEECNRFFDLDVDNDLLYGEAGSNFVVATVFPSREVQKSGIKLSWDLACVLGYPSVGRSLFISPLYTSDGPKHSDNVDILRVIKCKTLYLGLFPPEVGSSSRIESESDYCPERNRMLMETPKKSPSTTLHRKESHDFSSNSVSSMCLDPNTARSALADEKVNELLQTSATRWLNGRYLLKGNFVPLSMCGKLSFFVVMGAELDRSARGDFCEKGNTLSNAEDSANLGGTLVSFLVDRTTKIHLSDSVCTEKIGSDKPDLPSELYEYDNKRKEDSNCAPMLGGLSKESATIKGIISFSLADQIGLPRYRGILLYGPPGTGKTSLATSCAHESGANLFTINGPEIISHYYGESEQSLYDVFTSAKKAAPAVIFIDELDAIAPSRNEGGEELSIRMVATLLKLMDEIGPSDRVLLIAATNRPNCIDPALRRNGRLDIEIEIGVPSPAQRMDILGHLLIGVHHCLRDEEVESIALETHGFVGADLAALCNEAALCALRRYISRKENLSLHHPNSSVDKCIRDTDDRLGYQESSLSASLSTMSLDDAPCTNSDTKSSESSDVIDETVLSVNTEDFKKAKTKVRPSAMREVMLELPKVHWEDVGGQASVKEQLIEAIQWPQKCPEAFENLGIQPPRGLLMMGPPGCSKTLMARAAASEAKLNFLAVKGPELFSKWVGDSEKAVRSLFAKARANAPAILFFDELDGFAVTRGHENDGTSVADRVLSQLLVEMDGLDKRVGVIVIAATNRPDKIDPALTRPGRFDRLLDVQPPNEVDRADIFQIHTRSIPCGPDVSLEELARLTEGYTGADIKLVCREAAVAALDENFEIEEVEMRHFKSAISGVKPSDVKFYQKLARKYRRSLNSALAPGERCYYQKHFACVSFTAMLLLMGLYYTTYVCWSSGAG